MLVLKFYFQPDSKLTLLLFDSKFLNLNFTSLFVILTLFLCDCYVVVWAI